MSNLLSTAFNLDLLILDADDLKDVERIKVLDITDGFSKNFHPNGLFSTEIFGKIGEEKRNRIFAYIDMYVPIFHPKIFSSLVELKGLYGEIMAGQTYAVFDPETNDFEKSNPLDGETGFSFFVKNFEKLRFEKRPSPKREFNIALINKYRKNCLMNKLAVMPAGLRDYTIDENNKPSEDEINGMYRRVMSVASIVENVNVVTNIDYLDSARYSIQQRVLEIYNYITNLLEGKSKFFQSKWASRKVFDSTRNVITPYVPKTDIFFTPKTVSTNQTVVGMYQFMRSIMPLAVNRVRDTYLSDVFIGPNSPAVLVNKKTLKKELAHVSPDYYDDWMTYEGLEKTMSRFGQEELRDEVVEIEGRYLGLIYNDGKFVKFFQDIDDLPSKYDRSKVKPVTVAEILYLSLFAVAAETPGLVTRYPITGYGSVYPAYIYLKTTVIAQTLKVLDDMWEPGELCFEFPIAGEKYYNAMAPSLSHIARLGADYDGDTCSLICFMSEEAKEEVRELLNSRNYYVGVNGKMSFSASNDVIDLVLANITS